MGFWIIIGIAVVSLGIIVIIGITVVRAIQKSKLHKGVRLIENGELQDGIKLLKQITALDEYNVEACWALGKAYYTLKNWHYALYELKKLITVNTGAFVEKEELHLKLAEVYERLQNLDDALKEYLYVASLRGGSQSAIYLKVAFMYRDQGNLREALKYFVKVSEFEPTSDTAFMEAGKIYYNDNSLEPALNMFRGAVKANAKNFEAHYYVGNILYSLSSFDGAIEAYTAARGDAKLASQMNYYLGDCYYRIGQYKSAAEYFEKAMVTLGKGDERYFYACYNAGQCYEMWHDIKHAVDCYAKLYKVNPNYNDVRQKYALFKDVLSNPKLGDFLACRDEEFTLLARRMIERMSHEIKKIRRNENGVFDAYSLEHGVEKRAAYLWRIDRVNSKVTAADCEALLAMIHQEKINRVVYISAFAFAEGTEDALAGQPIELIDREKLMPFLESLT